MVELDTDENGWVMSDLNCDLGGYHGGRVSDDQVSEAMDKIWIMMHFWDATLRFKTRAQFPFEPAVLCRFITGELSADDLSVRLKGEDTEAVARLAVMFTRMRELECDYKYRLNFCMVSPTELNHFVLHWEPVYKRSPEAEAAYYEEYDKAYPLFHGRPVESVQDLFAICHYVSERLEARGFDQTLVDESEKDWFYKDNEFSLPGIIPLRAVDKLYDIAAMVGKQC